MVQPESRVRVASISVVSDPAVAEMMSSAETKSVLREKSATNWNVLLNDHWIGNLVEHWHFDWHFHRIWDRTINMNGNVLFYKHGDLFKRETEREQDDRKDLNSIPFH